MTLQNSDKKKEILQEFPFGETERFGGKVQLIRATVVQDGKTRVYINKKLLFTATGRFINLPRDGVGDMVAAILAASEPERVYHEELMAQINQQRVRRSPNSEHPRGGGGDRRRGGRDDKGDWK